MRWFQTGLATVALTAASYALAAPPLPPEALVQQGQFDEARAAYMAVPATAANYQVVQHRLAAIALYENRLDDADKLLRAAIARDPKDIQTMGLLAQLASRRDNFAEAAQWLNKMGRENRAAEFLQFGNSTPYVIPAGSTAVNIPFTQTDPVPAIMAKVNGHEGLFLIDTGAGEIVLDPDFAKAAGVDATGGDKGTFAGGKTADFPFGRITKLTLASLDIGNVPALLLSTKGFESAAAGKKIAGVIGTELLMHFLATIDYPAGKLVLAPRDTAASLSAPVTAIPFYLVGDHFMLARGKLDAGHEQLFLIDTGLAGFAFTAPASTLDDAKVPSPKPKGPDSNAVGQSPKVEFPIDSLTLGDMHAQKLTGLYGPFPAPLEGMLGVHVGGIVSHAFFRPYAVTFDFKQMKVLLHKPV